MRDFNEDEPEWKFSFYYYFTPKGKNGLYPAGALK